MPCPSRSGPSPPIPTALLERSREVRCAYCHDAFERVDAPRVCTGCQALLHGDCWREAGRCPSLGCRGPRVESQDVTPLLHALAVAAWASFALLLCALGGPFIQAAAAVLAAALSLVHACRRRADAVWLLALCGLGLVASFFVFVQSQRVFLTVD